MVLDAQVTDRLTTTLAAELARAGIESAGFSLGTPAGTLLHPVGGWTPSRAEHLMSSSKWLSAAVLMSLVDDESLQLDEPVVARLPWFADHDGAKAAITLRHCLSLTTGLPARHLSIMDPSITLRESVGHIAREPLLAAPGEAIVYGGNGFQVAGLLAEVATGESWNSLVERRLCRPLGLADTRFEDGRSRNPWLAGGARSSLIDMAAFLRLQLSGGVGRHGRVLTQWALAEMARDQAPDARVLQSPFGDGRRYGLGVWLDEVAADGTVIRVGSHGGAGSIPWFHRAAGYVAHLFVYQPDHAAFRGFRDALAISEQIDAVLAEILPFPSTTAAPPSPVAAGVSP